MSAARHELFSALHHDVGIRRHLDGSAGDVHVVNLHLVRQNGTQNGAGVGNVPCSTSNSSNRIFFAFLTMPPIIAKATSQSRPKRTPERTPSSSALAQDVQRKDARPSSTTSQMTLPPCAHSRIDIPKRQKGAAGSKPAAPSFGIPYLRAIPAGAAAGQSARRSVRRPCGFGRQLPTWPGRA